MALNRIEQDALITEHLPIVGYQVSEMIRRVPSHVQRDELAAAGSLALVQAARSFDPERGVPFARYASVRIRGAIVDELRGMDWATRGARRRARELASVTDELTSSLGRRPTREEIADAMGTDVAGIDSVRGDAERRILSLDVEGGESASTIASKTTGPEENLLVDERLRYLAAAVEELPERLRFVVRGLFFEDRTVVEIADELGVTQSRISQLRTQAMGMLKDAMNSALEPELAPEISENPGVAERRRQNYYAAVAERAGVGAARGASYAQSAEMRERLVHTA